MQPPPSGDDEAPPSSMDPTERAKLIMHQRMLEAQLEIVRSARLQRESRSSRRIWFVLVFALSACVAAILDHKGAPAIVSIGACFLTFVLIAGVWAFKKPY